MRFLPFICFLLTCISFPGGCGKKTGVDPVLARADTLMNVDHDSAEALLRSMHPRLSAFSEEEKAYYYLLRTQADYQTGNVVSDSLIKEAAGYYEKSPDRAKLAKAYLYLGKVNTALKNDSAALIYYIKAAERATADNDAKLLVDIHNCTGYIYLMQNLPEQALLRFRKAWHCMEASQEQKQFRFYLLRNMARSFSLQNLLGPSPGTYVDSAVIYFEKALSDSSSLHSREDICIVYRELSLLYTKMNNYGKALDCIRKGTDPDDPFSSSGRKAWIYAKMGKPDSAYALARKNTEDPNIYGKTTAYTLLFEIERMRGRPERALAYVDTLGILNDSIYKYVIPERIIEIQKRYNDEKLRAEKAEVEAEYEKEKSRSLKITLMVVLLMIAGAVFIAYTFTTIKVLFIGRNKNMLLL